MKFLKRVKDEFTYDEFVTFDHNQQRLFHTKFILYRNKTRTKRKLKIIADNMSEAKKTYFYSVLYAWKNGHSDDDRIKMFKQDVGA
jgi:hypothetical protein